MLGIIGGSGLTRLDALDHTRREVVTTPYGPPSSPLVFGTVRRSEVVFLARHGEQHTIPPHAVNYRANMWALHDRKALDVVAVAAVGGIRRDLAPGTLVIPDQIIDYTYARESTYFEGGEAGVTHIDFTRPYCEAMRERLLAAAVEAGEAVADGGTYGATQGPRLETAAEIDRMERDGADVVGMTAMPEAALARELGICYAAIAVVVNPAAGRGSGAAVISLEDMMAVLRPAIERVERIIECLAGRYGG